MKTKNSIKLILSIIAITSFMFLLKSCKKADIAPPDNAKTAQDVKAASLKAIKAQYGDVSAGLVFNVNKTADEVFYRNAVGKMVSLYGSGGNQVVAGPCIYNCNNTTNPANLRIVTTLDYVQRFYLCESGSSPAKSTLTAKWTVSVPFGITDVTPDGVLNTFGKVKFTPSSGPAVILTATANDPGFVYTSLGTDPACGANTLYSVTYYFNDVDNANFASGTQLDALLSLSNDCSLIGNLLSTGYVSGPSFNQNAYLPCNRIDKVYVNPPSNIALGNSGGTCTQPSGWQYINYHQLEYRQKNVSSFNWDDQTSTIRWGTPSGGGATIPNFSPFDFVTLSNITSGSGWWLVRYRNVKTGTCDIIYGSPSAPGQPWGNTALWITEAFQY